MSEKVNNSKQDPPYICRNDNTRYERKPNYRPTFNFQSNNRKDIYGSLQADTTIVRYALPYVNRVWEDTTSHYNFLKDNLGKQIADYYKNSQWCALTVSIFAKKAGINLGSDFIPTVSGFVQWAGRRYKKIHTTKLTSSNINQERGQRAVEIKKQLAQMKEGDFIVWQADKAFKDKNNWKIEKASHIGLIKSVNPQKGTVTVIEGNANIPVVDKNGEPILVKNKKEGQNGNQLVGEVREKNPHDGLIEKVYTIEDLVRYGYSGFIDNKGLV